MVRWCSRRKRSLHYSNAVSPALRDLFQRTVSNDGLFHSSLPTAALVLVQDPQQRLSLKTSMEWSNRRALQWVRKGLDGPKDKVKSCTKLSIFNLCLAAVAAGDVEATGVHLRGLSTLDQPFKVGDSLESLAWHMIRICHVCHAIQTAQSPLFPYSHISTADQWSAGEGGSHESVERSHWVAKTNGSQAMVIQDQWPLWLDAQLVSEYLHPCVVAYKSTVCAFPEHARLPRDSAVGLNSVFNRGLACLYELCTLYQQLHCQTRNVQGIHLYDSAVVISLQIHLALHLGGLLSRVVNTLHNRLYAHVRQAFRSAPSGSVDGSVAVRQRCELWLLLTGLLTAADSPEQREWFREEALLRTRALQIWTKPDLWPVCSPFGFDVRSVSPAFLKCATNLLAEGCPMGFS